MAYQYVTYPLGNLGGGIDQQSAENQIKEGYCELLLNADPEPMGYLSKRLGYQRHSGQLPVRVTRVEYAEGTENNLCLFLDSEIDISSINLLTTRRTPLVIYGRTSEANSSDVGDFPQTDVVNYYPTFNSDVEQVFNEGANTLQNDGIGSPDVFIHTSRKLNFVDTSNSEFLPSEVRVDESTGNIEVDYNNNTGDSFEGYLYVSPKPELVGTTYISDTTPGSRLEVLAGSSNITIPTATHNLSNFNIDTRVYEIVGTTYTEVTPDEVKIATNGDVQLDFVNNTGSTKEVVVYLTAYPAENVKFSTVASGATTQVVLEDLTSDFVGVVAYVEPILGGEKLEVLPDSIVVDSNTNQATISFTNNAPDPANLFIYWEEVEITSNKLCLNASEILPGDTFVDTNPQLTIWGLDHAVIYGQGSVEQRPGWVTHLDSYKSEGDNRLVAGLGGNIFTESGQQVQYGMPTLYPNINGRVSANVNVGPAFYNTVDTPTRTRGYIRGDSIEDNLARIDSISYVSGTQVAYEFSDDNLVITGTFSDIISSDAGLEDWIRVSAAGNSRHNGTFRVVSTSQPTPTSVRIVVDNPAVKCSDFDETNSSARLGVFTDRITQLANSKFLVDDLIASDLFGFDANYLVRSNQSTTVLVDNFTSPQLLPAGLRLVGRRTTNLLPLRDVDSNPDVDNLVVNDSITRPGLTRKLTAKFINPRPDETVSITGDGNTATVTLTTSSAFDYSVGQTILLQQSGDFSGEQVITSISGSQEIQFSSTELGTQSGTIFGKTVVLDESLTIEDTIDNSITYSVQSRWVPIEAPTDTFEKTRKNYVQHFDANEYSNQEYLKSVMVSDNLYLTNGQDEVMKYDGLNVYRAGLFRWQPQLFMTTTEAPTSGGLIDFDAAEAIIIPAESSGNKLAVEIGDQTQFSVGQSVRTNLGDRYTITEIYEGEDAANDPIGIIKLNDVFAGAPTSISEISQVRYYFRLNAVDANGNVIASAVSGSEDQVVELAAPTQIRIRLVGIPAWHIYDYDSLEVEIYRTQVGTEAPYYKLQTIPMTFNQDGGYIDFVDSKSGETLRDLDVVNTAFFGGTNLGTQFSEPMRSRYITSAGNKLVQANLTDYQQLDIKYETELTTLTSLDGDRYFFRKDNTDASSTSNLEDRQGYEFVTSASGTIDPAADISQTTNDFTIQIPGHSLTAGNWIYLYHASTTKAERNLTYSGWWRISSVVAGTSITINHAGVSGYTPSVADVDRYTTASSQSDVPVLLGEDGNYSQSSYNPSASAEYTEVALIRLANAINTSMRAALEGWMTAGAGGDFETAQLVIRQPKVLDTFLEVELPAYESEEYSIFVQSILRAPNEQVSASSNLYPSRLIVSGNNYPEIFDNPRAVVDSQSSSAIDVNSADGEQITGVIPFFGDSAFGSAQKDSILVVFKEASIYLVNLAAKEAGQSAVQKIESQGLGCTSPASIAVTRNGIMFANRSGIFKLTRDLKVEYAGRMIERSWESKANLDELDEAVGHHYAIGRQYKLSYPSVNTRRNSNVFVYNHTREYTSNTQMGSWTEYSNHPTTGWCNLLSNAYFSTSAGSVMLIRNTGDVSDYRDDDQAIDMQVVFRATDFGDAAIRKVVANIVCHFRNLAAMNGTKISSVMDLSNEFNELDQFIIKNQTSKVRSIQFSVDRRKGVYFQVKLTNSTIDEPVELTGIDIRVAGLNSAAITQAGSTT